MTAICTIITFLTNFYNNCTRNQFMFGRSLFKVVSLVPFNSSFADYSSAQEMLFSIRLLHVYI